MAAKAYGGLVTLSVAAKTMTELLRQVYGDSFQKTVFCTLTTRAHFDNADRIFLQIDGTDSDWMVPGEPLDYELAHGPVYTDQMSYRAIVPGDRMYITAFEA